MDGGSAAIGDPVELKQVRRQARLVHLKSFLAALVLTLVVVFIY